MFLVHKLLEKRGGSRVFQECFIKVDLQISVDFQILEVKMGILGIFPHNIVLWGCISVIIDYDVLDTL